MTIPAVTSRGGDDGDQSYHHGSLRAALLVQAEASLKKGGVEGLSLRQLAREIGVSHGAPARHFKDRQALLDALALDGFERLNASLVKAVGAPSDLRERFDALIAAYVTFACSHPELLQVMYTIKHGESASERLRDEGYRGLVVAQALLEQADTAGLLSVADAQTTAVVVTAQVHGVATLASLGMLEVSTTEAITVTSALLWKALE